MSEKKNRVLELAKQEPKLSRAEIARQAGCSTPFVTQTLGASRKYNLKKPTPPAVVAVVMCDGCLDPNCKLNGCMGS